MTIGCPSTIKACLFLLLEGLGLDKLAKLRCFLQAKLKGNIVWDIYLKTDFGFFLCVCVCVEIETVVIVLCLFYRQGHQQRTIEWNKSTNLTESLLDSPRLPSLLYKHIKRPVTHKHTPVKTEANAGFAIALPLVVVLMHFTSFVQSDRIFFSIWCL